MKNLITATIVDFVEWVERRIFNIATTVECALIDLFTLTTIAKVESTNPIVLSARSSSLVRGVHPTRCHVDTRSTGSVFDNWQHMIRDVQSVRRLLKQERG